MGEAQKSMDEITAMLVDQPAAEVVPDEETSIPSEGDEEPVVETEESSIPFTADEDDGEEAETEADNEVEDQGEEQAASDDPEPYLDVTDDDLIEVKVDGEVVYRSVADAKKALSGEGAIDKRLKEVTEERNRLITERRTGLQQLEEGRERLLTTAQQVQQFMLQPTVARPDESLRMSNPQEYIAQIDAFNADQARIQQVNQQFQQNLQKQQQEREANLAQMRKQNEFELMEYIPDLRVPEKQEPIMRDILSVARDFGYSDNEIATIFDARAYRIAYELAQLRKEKGTVDVKKVKEKAKTTRTPRRLRSGVAAKMTASKQKLRAKKADVNRAKSTGKVDDVVRTIINPAR